MKSLTSYEIYNIHVANMAETLLGIVFDSDANVRACDDFSTELDHIASSRMYGLMTYEEEATTVYNVTVDFMRGEGLDKLAINKLSPNAVREAMYDAARRFTEAWMNLGVPMDEDDLDEGFLIDEPSIFDDLTVDIRNPDKPGRMRRMLRVGW